MGAPDPTVPFVDLERIHAPIRARLDAAIAEVLDSGAFILGEHVERFERAYAAYVGTDHAVGVASGTAALSIALRAAGIGPGDEVVVPAHTFSASALAILHAGAEPVFCDVDEETGLIDPASAEAAVGPRTAAVIAVDLYGQAVDPAPLESLCETAGLALIEDAAQAHGAAFCGRRAGSFGLASTFSFYPSKNLGAFGDAGMVCTDDAELAQRARDWRNLGQEGKGPHRVPAGNDRLDTLQAAVLDVKLPHLEGWNEQRRQAIRLYEELLPATVARLPRRPGANDVHHLLPVRVPGGARDDVRSELAAAGIQTGIHYFPAVHRQPAFDGLGRRPEIPLGRSETWAAEELSLPIFAGLTEQEVRAVCAALARATGLRAPLQARA